MSVQPMLLQQGLYLLTPTMQGTNLLLTIQGGKTNEIYNILFTPNLFDNMTNTDWVQAGGSGTPGQTNFTIATMGNAGFYRVQVANITNGIQSWQYATPNDPASGLWTITIDTPQNGSTVR